MASSVSAASSSNRTTAIGEAEAIAKLKSLRDDQLLVVDFDQTLFLRNSSTDFIRMAKPFIFGAILYKLLEVIRPWSWFARGRDTSVTRDWFHIWAITIFFPWTWLLWRIHAAKLAQNATNQELAAVLKERNPEFNVLSTQGFGPVVGPLVKHMGVEFGIISTCRMFGGFSDRLRGKVKALESQVGSAELKRSAVITDSEDDRDLLDHAEVPLMIQWPEPPNSLATPHYVPFYYLSKIKLKGLSRILREVFYVDLLLLYLAFTWISPFPLLHGVGITLFYMSFLLIYEIGYMENDDVAFQLEKDPIIGDSFEKKRGYISYFAPWLWATPFTFVGAGIMLQIDYLVESGVTASSLFSDPNLLIESASVVFFTKSQLFVTAIWLGLLLSMRYVYKFYNYTDKMTRTWVYPILQIYKSIAFIFVSPINVIGAVALFCQVVGRSFAYFLYRWGRKDWPGSELYLFRFILFVGLLLTIGHVIENRYAEFATFQTLAICIWMSSRALKPMVMVYRNMKHIANDDWTRADR